MKVPLIVCLATLVVLTSVQAQFPRMCIHNATSGDDSTCCPSWPGDSTPCGGSTRGTCVSVDQIGKVEDLHNMEYVLDSRFQWPRKFFQNVCECKGHFTGYMCQECQYGYYGPDCNEKKVTTRQNALSLDDSQRTVFRDVMNQAKYTQSDYVIFLGRNESGILYTNVSVYDFLNYIHMYSSKSLAPEDMLEPCLQVYPKSTLDFSHKGPAFLTWHRAFLLVAERELQKIAGGDHFTIPYWDWAGDNETCNVCVNDLVGATNYSDPKRLLDKHSIFSSWQVLCPQYNITTTSDAAHTSLDEAIEVIRRGPPQTEEQRRLELPDLLEVQGAFQHRVYDTSVTNTEPEDHTGFREAVEGTTIKLPGELQQEDYTMSLKVHKYLNGTMTDVTMSAADPIFLLHHSYVDMLFELWLRENSNGTSELPKDGAQPGHNRDSLLVPFFPPINQSDFYVDSRTLGYEYTNIDVLKASVYPSPHNGNAASLLASVFTVSIGVIIFAPAMLYIAYYTCRLQDHLPAYRPVYKDYVKVPDLEDSLSSSYGSTANTHVAFYVPSSEEDLSGHFTKQGYLPVSYSENKPQTILSMV